jgi:hypothetical protein
MLSSLVRIDKSWWAGEWSALWVSAASFLGSSFSVLLVNMLSINPVAIPR